MADHNPFDRSHAGRVDLYETIHGDRIVRIQSSLSGDHPFLRLIGRVASEWTHFENILDEIIIRLANLPEDVALCITRHLMGATPRFKMIESLGNLCGVDPALLKKTRQLKTEQYETGERRNRIIHDPWFDVQFRELSVERHDETMDALVETKQLKTSGYEPVSEDEILKTIESIKTLIRRAAELQIEFLSQPTSSSRTRT